MQVQGIASVSGFAVALTEPRGQELLCRQQDKVRSVQWGCPTYSPLGHMRPSTKSEVYLKHDEIVL